MFGLPQVSVPAQASNVEVLAQGDSYLISGGVIHHSNFTRDRKEAASCTDCFWKVQAICKSWQDSNHGACPWLRLQCPSDMQLVEVFRANAVFRPTVISSLWYFVGYSCIGDAGPISTIDLYDHLAKSWIIEVPKLRIRFSPANDAILSHPLKYEILSKTEFDVARDVFSTSVTLHAQSHIEFACESSFSSKHCISQKSNQIKFKKVGLSYLFAKSIWSATFDAAGILGISVPGPNPTSEIKSLFNVHPLFTHLMN